jgi:hypothetical protein
MSVIFINEDQDYGMAVMTMSDHGMTVMAMS